MLIKPIQNSLDQSPLSPILSLIKQDFDMSLTQFQVILCIKIIGTHFNFSVCWIRY